MTYRPKQPARLAPLEAARGIEDAGERIRTLFLGKDKVGAFLRETLGPTLVYTARVAPDIAHSIDDVDRAMRWGFGWELGPFEIWDAIGLRAVLDAVGGGAPVPPLVEAALRSPSGRFRDDGLPPAGPGLADPQDREGSRARSSGATRARASSTSTTACWRLEFHSKMNTIGGDTIEMLHAGVAEAATNFAALVVGNDAPNFSAGANLMLLLLEAQEGNWDEIDLMVRAFQGATSALRFADVPVVVCPAGLTLGGGCELLLHADRVQAAAESYIGLVEAGVGLIPAGGGTKEMLARAVETAPPGADLLPIAQRVFETIGFARVSTSAADARRFGFLRDVDAVSMNRERLIADAKALALERVREGYRPPPRRTAMRVGGDGVLAALKLGVHLAWRAGRISDHDALVGRTLATVLAGGALANHTTVSEAVPAGPGARGVPEAVRRAQDARADPAHAEDGQDAAELKHPITKPNNQITLRPDDQMNDRTLILLPGIQGRAEYVEPARDALASSFRVLAMPLCGERGTLARLDPARGVDDEVARVVAELDRQEIDRAVVCGVSYGGVIALQVAARHPDRVAALVLASTPGPDWRLTGRHAIYARWPRLCGTLFALETPGRLRAEIAAALPRLGGRLRFIVWHLLALVRAPLSYRRMADRAHAIETTDRRAACAAIAAPTLIVAGAPGLDRIVPEHGVEEYVPLVRGARRETLDRTGHIGSITRPSAFASLVGDFVDRALAPAPPRDRTNENADHAA